MDSLTQITLGAAVGEVVLGKKIGNRAMLWGAIGGTIPDLDIIGNGFMTEIEALAFHRGISHSIFFAVLGAFGFAWLAQKLYDTQLYQQKIYKGSVSLSSFLFVGLIAFGIGWLSKSLIISIFLFSALMLLGFWLYRNYFNRQLEEVNVAYKEWYWLFFWSLLTHPILDCFTAYGTQLYLPFTNTRVAWSTISVADPIYTTPFLVCLIAASFFARNTRRRAILNWLGIGLSSAYLLFTVFNKMHVNSVFEDSFAANNIKINRYVTNPVIFNNVLWQGVAESDTAYYYGTYSIFDSQEAVTDIKMLPKNHELLKGIENEKDIETLKWFSDGYYNVFENGAGKFQFNDLRYGSMGEFTGNERQYVFRFDIEKTEDGLKVGQTRDDPREISDEVFAALWERIKGR